MPTETTTNEKKVTLAQLKKAMARAKQENEEAISAIGSDETATDAEVDAMLDEVFGASDSGATSTEDNA